MWSRVGTCGGVSVLIEEEETREFALPCEDTTGRRTSIDQEEGLHQNPTMLAP